MGAERVLVTGASAGIGAELARLFAAEGCELILVARRRERLDELAAALTREFGVRCSAVAADLGRPRAGRDLARELASRGLEVDVLVNNAGFGNRDSFAAQDADRQREMIDLNVTELVGLTRALLPAMLDRGRGGVVNIASTAAFQAGPYMAVYYATKAFVLSFTEALSVELEGTGVTATCVCPGATRSEFAEVAGMGNSKAFELSAMSAASVARLAHRGFRRGRTVVVTGAVNRLGTIFAKLAPRALTRRLVARLQAPS